MYFALFVILLAASYFREKADYQLVLAFIAFPTSWAFFSGFHSVLEFVGPIGSGVRHVGEWTLLGFAGSIQYFLVGTASTYLIEARNSEKT